MPLKANRVSTDTAPPLLTLDRNEETVCLFWRREKSFIPTGNQIPDCPTHSLVTIQAELRSRCYVGSNGKQLLTFQGSMVTHLHHQAAQEGRLTLKVEASHSSKTSVTIYQSIRHNIQKTGTLINITVRTSRQ
jgi:hypothetical protein